MIGILVLGLVIFFAVHAIPAMSLRDSLIEKFGFQAYRGLFALGSIIGFALIIYGKGYAEFISVWSPPAFTRHITMLFLLIAMLMLGISLVPNNLRRFIRHPMLLSVAFWGTGHLISNGDLASIILFGSFLAFSIQKMISQSRRGPFEPPEKVAFAWNAGAVVGGVAVYGLAVKFHQSIAGIPLF